MQDATTYRRPLDGSPMYGDETTYGTSERRCYPCLICSGVEGWTLVLPDDLAEHAQGHVDGYAAYLREQEGKTS